MQGNTFSDGGDWDMDILGCYSLPLGLGLSSGHKIISMCLEGYVPQFHLSFSPNLLPLDRVLEDIVNWFCTESSCSDNSGMYY